MDGRRRRYVPLDVDVAFRNTGSKLLERLGNEGLLIWMLYLAACKREPLEGTFTYTSDPEAWSKLGAQATAFTVPEFFTHTGRLKATRKRKVARVTYIECVGWDKWNRDWKRQQHADNTQQEDAQDTARTPETHDVKTQITQNGQQKDTQKAPAKDHVLQTEPGTFADAIARPEVEAEVELENELENQSVAKLGAYPLLNPEAADEKEAELQRLIKQLRHKDASTEGFLRQYAAQLPVAALASAREAIALKTGLRHDGRYASALLREWIADGRYARSAA